MLVKKVKLTQMTFRSRQNSTTIWKKLYFSLQWAVFTSPSERELLNTLLNGPLYEEFLNKR